MIRVNERFHPVDIGSEVASDRDLPVVLDAIPLRVPTWR